MNNQTSGLWILLQESGIVQDEQPEKGAIDSPWYVKMILAFSGWLAAFFILGFIGAAVFRNSGVAGIVGLLMIAGAFALLRTSANEFLEHLGLATSIAGQILIVYAIFDLFDYNQVAAWLLLSVLQAALVVFMPNFVHRVFSTLVAAIAFSMVFNEMNIPYVTGGIVMFGASFCWLNEFRYPQQMEKVRAIGYGLILALIAIESMALFGYRVMGERLSQKLGLLAQPWLGEIIIGVVTVYIAWSLLQRYGQPLNSRLSIATLLATLLICAVSFNVQGITVGMAIVCFGFFRSNRVLLGLGIVSLLFYISSYYYLLDRTLLDKSLSLLLVGLILLFIRGVMSHIFPTSREVRHA